jgi:FkbM family methyltransferase
MTAPRSVRIDCGANRGIVLDAAATQLPHFEHIAYEANPRLIPALMAVRARHPSVSISIHHAAVWTADGAIDFFLTDDAHDPNHEGSTLARGKSTGAVNYAAPVRVPSIDLDRTLRQFTPADTVILKMDIEGAEYDVLERLLDTGSINRLSALLVETHAHKISTIPQHRHDRLIQRLTAWGGAPRLRDTKHIGWARDGVPQPWSHVRAA